jgi:hypothetical protein
MADTFTAGRNEAAAPAKIDIGAFCMAMACQRGRYAVAYCQRCTLIVPGVTVALKSTLAAH